MVYPTRYATASICILIKINMNSSQKKSTSKGLSRWIGPGVMVTAAFIGPGTLTMCTVAGAGFGYDLLWVLIFAVIATIVLQELTIRIGLVTGKGLGAALHTGISSPLIRRVVLGMVFVAIIFGNAAYEAGNITGAVLGMGGMIEGTAGWMPLVIGGIAFGLLWTGQMRIITRTLMVLVLVMSILFFTTLFVVDLDIPAMLRGMAVPSLSSENLWTVLALVGTTIVPYNLFLHASAVNQRYSGTDQLSDAKRESRTAIIVGGVISMCILITSAATLYGQDATNVQQIGTALSHLIGDAAHYVIGVGLFAAGISSAITAPLAAAYTAQGIFGWKSSRGRGFRVVWMVVLGIGILFSMLGYKPIYVIKVAQVANSLVLPLIAILLVYFCNRSSLLGNYVNTRVQNIFSILVVLLCVFISIKGITGLFL